MSHRICGFLAVLALAVLIAPGPARADTITPMFFDGFEADKGDVLDAKLVNWNVISGSVDVLSGANLCGPSGDYTKCVDLDGTGDQAGTIATKATFNLAPGLYLLSFDLAGANRKWPGSTDNTVVVSLGSYFSEAFSPLQWDPFVTFTREIVVDTSGTAKIQLSHSGHDWIGLLLDNVRLAKVEREVVPTPEGGAWELTVAMLGIVAVWIFRKKARVLGEYAANRTIVLLHPTFPPLLLPPNLNLMCGGSVAEAELFVQANTAGEIPILLPNIRRRSRHLPLPITELLPDFEPDLRTA